MTRGVVALFALAAVLMACTPSGPLTQTPRPSVLATVPLPAATATRPLPTPIGPSPLPSVPTLPSPNASGTLAFVALAAAGRQSNIMLMNADGSDLRPLPNSSGAAAVSWSPDGKRLAYIVHHSDADWSMYIVDADGSNLQRITRGNLDHFPAWSPDGTQIVFTRNGNVWTMHVSAGFPIEVNGLRQLTADPREYASIPTWSPDGTQIAFASQLGDAHGVAPYNDPKTAELYVMKADGSGLRKLTDNQATDGTPAWSPDGRQIAFSSDREGKFQIYVMDSDGSNAKRLTDSDANDVSPAWSPDGREIVFASDRDGPEHTFQLYGMNMDGSNPTRLTNNSTSDSCPAWKPAALGRPLPIG